MLWWLTTIPRIRTAIERIEQHATRDTQRAVAVSVVIAVHIRGIVVNPRSTREGSAAIRVIRAIVVHPPR